MAISKAPARRTAPRSPWSVRSLLYLSVEAAPRRTAGVCATSRSRANHNAW